MPTTIFVDLRMSTIEPKFAALQTEWLTVCSHVHKSIARWEYHFGALRKEEAKLRDEGRWTHGRDDFLGVLDRHRDELAHSRMIGCWIPALATD